MIIPSIHTIEGIAFGLLIGSFIPNPLRALKALIVKAATKIVASAKTDVAKVEAKV